MGDPYEKLALKDEELFVKGACHVFAMVLWEKLRNKDGFQLLRIEVEPRRCPGDHAVHVFIRDGSRVFDARGTHDNPDSFLEDWKNRADAAWPEDALSKSEKEPSVSAKETSISELLFEDSLLSRGPFPKNQWDHHLDRHFLICCAARASLYIAQNHVAKWPSLTLS